MKEKKALPRKKIMIVLVTIICVIILPVFAFAVKAKRQPYLSPEVAALYQNESFSSLTKKIAACDSFENMDLDAYAALADMLAEADADTYVGLFKENKDSPLLLHTFLSVAADNDIAIPRKTIEEIVFDKQIDVDIRTEAVFYCGDRADEYEQVLEDLVEDEELAFLALRELYSITPEKAIAYTNEIFAQYNNGEFSKQLQGALHIKSAELNKASTPEERSAYIDFCDKLSKGAAKNDDSIKDLLLNYIAFIDSWESLSYLIDHEGYQDRVSLLSMFNINTIQAILEGAPDEKTLDVALRAMIISPKPMFYESLTANIETNAAFYEKNPELAEKAAHALTLVTESKTNAGL